MNRYLASASVLVLAVAGFKTVLMTSFVLPSESANVATLTGLFASFTVMTAGVAYIAYKRINSFIEAQRRQKLAPGGGDTASKDAVVQKFAQEWGLSNAEAEVALFAAKGFSNSEIAEMRGSSVPTVKSQLGNIYQKSRLESRYQLIAFVTDEVCEMATETDGHVAQQEAVQSNVTPLVQKVATTSKAIRPTMRSAAVGR